MSSPVRQQLVQSVSVCLEAIYRNCGDPSDGALTADSYARLIERVACGGCQQKGTLIVESGLVRLVNTDCPLHEQPARARTAVCRTASRLLGEIAARNFGYAKVALVEGGGSASCCELSVFLNPHAADHYEGDEYGPSAALERPLSPHCTVLTSENPSTRRPFSRLVAYSPAIRKLLIDVDTVAPTTASVLVTGETGVGKELIARRLHAASARAAEAFVAVNCGAIPTELVDSALFGHEKGAFTGAHQRHKGYFERAQNGTLFLDEVDALSTSAQVRLLRVLQEGEYERVGGHCLRLSNARVIAATNRPLCDLVRNGQFRQDLWFRISTVHFHIPPLRESKEAIPLLVENILTKLRTKYQKPIRAVSKPVMQQLHAYDWPGNIRELENVLERSCLFARTEILEHIELNVPIGTSSTEGVAEAPAQKWQSHKRRLVEREERRYLEHSLRRFQGDLSEIARDMSLTKRSIYLKLRRYGLNPNQFRA